MLTDQLRYMLEHRIWRGEIEMIGGPVSKYFLDSFGRRALLLENITQYGTHCDGLAKDS